MRRIWRFLANERYVVPFLLAGINTAIVTVVLLSFRESLQIATIALLYLLPVGASAACGTCGRGSRLQLRHSSV